MSSMKSVFSPTKSSPTTTLRPELKEERRETMITKAQETLAKLERRLVSTRINLDAIRQYRRAAPQEKGVDAQTKQLEENLQVEIQGLERRIQTTQNLLQTLENKPTAAAAGLEKELIGETTEPADLLELTRAFAKMSLRDAPGQNLSPSQDEKFVLKYDTATCINPDLPPAGEFAIPAKVLMGQVIEELDHKFHHPSPKANSSFNLDDDDFSAVLDVIDEQLSPLEGLELIDDTKIVIQCGLTELCHRVVNMGGGNPECVLDGVHKMNEFAARLSKNYAMKKK